MNAGKQSVRWAQPEAARGSDAWLDDDLQLDQLIRQGYRLHEPAANIWMGVESRLGQNPRALSTSDGWLDGWLSSWQSWQQSWRRLFWQPIPAGAAGMLLLAAFLLTRWGPMTEQQLMLQQIDRQWQSSMQSSLSMVQNPFAFESDVMPGNADNPFPAPAGLTASEGSNPFVVPKS